MSVPLALQFLLAASQIWTDPAHVDPEGAFVSGRSEESIRLYGARGEAVSCWVTIESGRKPVVGLIPTPEAPGPGFAPPTVWQVDALPVRDEKGALRPVLDLLRPPEAKDLERDTAVHYWVSYTIPPDAPAGAERGKLRFDTDTRQDFELPVRIEVFDFALPGIAAYPLLVPIDRTAILSATGLEESPENWRSVYDFLGRYRLSPVLWNDAAFFLSDAPAELAEHARYALENAGAAVIDFGGAASTDRLLQPGRSMLHRAEIDAVGVAQSSLAVDSLTARGVVSYTVPAARDAWRALAEILDAHAQRAPDIIRMLSGALAFPLLSHADAWALPYRQLTPGLRAEMEPRRAFPRVRFPVHLIQPTASGRWQGYDTLPSDAFDGNPYTGWVAPGGKGTLEVELAGPVATEQIDIVWLEDNVAREIEVITSRDGTRYTSATVNWEITPARPELGQPTIHRGTFKYPQTLFGLRLILSAPAEGKSIAVGELRLPEHDQQILTPTEEHAAPQIWTVIEAEQFPSPMPGFHPAAATLLPWWCAARGATGARLPGFAPATTRPDAKTAVSAVDAAAVLAWPVGKALAPSVRLERIRIGMQSYAYGQIARTAGIPGDWVTRMPEAFDTIAFGVVPKPGELDALLENHVAWRIAAGRVIGDFMQAADDRGARE